MLSLHKIDVKLGGEQYLKKSKPYASNTQMDPPAARLHATPVQAIQLWVRATGAVIVTTTRKGGIKRLRIPRD